MKIVQTAISGCLLLQPDLLHDERGSFVKVFREDWFRDHGMAVQYAEEYYSLSRQGVLRGLHLQTPPAQHAKLVYCPQGEVLDAALDLRRGSPTYGQHLMLTLSSANGHALYMPAGVAHGFYTVSEQALMVYKVTSGYDPQHDCGILWNSAGIVWPTDTPVLSARDRQFPTLAAFDSPFRFDEARP